MIKVEYTHSAYMVRLSNLHSDKKRELPAKFDTGAVSTMVSLRALTDVEYSEDEIVKRINKMDKSKRVFKSASGHDMIAVKCCLENVFISDLKIKKFYFYLTPSSSKKTILIGDDLISYCDFAHNKKSDIIINNFYQDDYISDNEQNCISVNRNELDEIINNWTSFS